jgi:hypothetical protein
MLDGISLPENQDADWGEMEGKLYGAIRQAEMGAGLVELDEKFRTFRNAIDFVVHPEGLGLLSLYEFPRQYQYLRDFYSLICPNCNEPGRNPRMPYDCWGMSPAQLQDQILFERTEDDETLRCPKCQKTQAKCGVIVPQTLVGCAGMRSGKSILAAMIVNYELHCDLMIPDPQKKWGLAPGQRIDYTVIATKVEQAEGTIFAAVSTMHDNSPWFTRYNRALLDKAKEKGISKDDVYVKNLTDIRYYHKNFFIENAGTNSAGLAGKTRKVVVIDEIGRMVQTESRMGVDAVYDTLDRSLLTLSDFGSKMICISSPWLKEDKIMQLVQNAEEMNNPRTLHFIHATWDFNPKFPRDHPKIVEAFQTNPTNARRDYGCDPPGVSDPWIPPERVDDCVDPQATSIITVQDYTDAQIYRDGTPGGKRVDMVAKRVLWKDLETTKHIVISCDPGHRRDSFGMILAYLKMVATPASPRTGEPHMFVGHAMAWEPTQKPRREVSFRNVVDLIKEFDKHWVVDRVIYDQWQSVPLIQELQASSIAAMRSDLKQDDWDLLAALFYNRQIHLLHPSVGGKGSERLIWELKNLQIKANFRVDHSPTTSSDIAVCLARAAKALLSEEATQHRVMDAASRMIGKTVSFHRP